MQDAIYNAWISKQKIINFQEFNCYFMSDLNYWNMQRIVSLKKSCNLVTVSKKREKCATELTLFSLCCFILTVTKWNSKFRKTLLSQSVILITRLKSGAILFWGRCQLIFDKNFPKNATFKLSLMSNDEPKNFIHFYILHIKNVQFLQKLEMALVTPIKMKFVLVWFTILEKVPLES